MTLDSQSLNLNARQILIKRLNQVQAEAYIGPLGELIYDTTQNLLRIQNGLTPGGIIFTNRALVDSLLDSLETQINANVAAVQTQVTNNLSNAQQQFTQVTSNFGNVNSRLANLQSQITSILSNVDPAVIDSFTEVLANVIRYLLLMLKITLAIMGIMLILLLLEIF